MFILTRRDCVEERRVLYLLESWPLVDSKVMIDFELVPCMLALSASRYFPDMARGWATSGTSWIFLAPLQTEKWNRLSSSTAQNGANFPVSAIHCFQFYLGTWRSMPAFKQIFGKCPLRKNILQGNS